MRIIYALLFFAYSSMTIAIYFAATRHPFYAGIFAVASNVFDGFFAIAVSEKGNE